MSDIPGPLPPTTADLMRRIEALDAQIAAADLAHKAALAAALAELEARLLAQSDRSAPAVVDRTIAPDEEPRGGGWPW